MKPHHILGEKQADGRISEIKQTDWDELNGYMMRGKYIDWYYG